MTLLVHTSPRSPPAALSSRLRPRHESETQPSEHSMASALLQCHDSRIIDSRPVSMNCVRQTEAFRRLHELVQGFERNCSPISLERRGHRAAFSRDRHVAERTAREPPSRGRATSPVVPAMTSPDRVHRCFDHGIPQVSASTIYTAALPRLDIAKNSTRQTGGLSRSRRAEPIRAVPSSRSAFRSRRSRRPQATP